MKTLKSISKKVLVALLFVLTVSCFALATGVNVRAEGNFPAEAKIEVLSGTSLKLNEKGGLRFIIKLNDAAKKYIKDDDTAGNIKLVAYIAPTAIVNKGDEYLIANGLRAEVAEGKIYQPEGDGNWYANVCPVDFKEANRKLDYSVKAFVMNGEIVEATTVLNDEARGNVYDVATRALLDETEDYTQKILDLGGYSWLGTEQFPIYIDSIALYNGLVSKINADFDFSEKYVAIASSVNTAEGTALAEGKTLPVNNYRVSRVTFMDGETVLGSVLAKEGEGVSFTAPEKTADETCRYTFKTWVTAEGGDEEADLTSVSQDMMVYAKYNQIYINAITELSAENVKYGNDYYVTAKAKYGTPVLTFSKEENGEYKAWNELENHDGGTYYVKATVTATEEYDGAEKTTSFKIEQAENAITSFVVPETISCNETLAPAATATYGDVKIKYVKSDDTLCDTLEEAKGSIVGNNISYKVQAIVEGTANYAGAAQEKIFKITHDFADGVCKKCNKSQTGIKYATTETVAYITGYEGNPSTEVYPVAVYDGKPVTYVAQEAFNKQTITKIVLPESVTDLGGRAFLNCSKLEYVSMIGVKSLKYNVTGRPDGKNESNNNFLYCNKLETVIVSPDFNTEVQQFYTDIGVSPLSLFVNGESGAPVLTDTDNLFNGNVYYKGDATKCGQWNFVDGELKHGPASHNFVNGVCENCGRYGDELTQGVVYGYNAEMKCYYVGNNKALNVAEVNILGKYNDGVNGEAEVKYLASKAFQGNTNITKIILPSSVDSLEGWVFGGCANLEYVSMTGITNLDYASPYGGERNNNFRECFKLKVVIVSNALSSNVGQFGCGATDAGNKKILDFYVDGESGAPSLDYVTADANNLCSGVVYYKGDASKCGQWDYVDGELKHGPASHNFVDGVCKDCGRVQSETVTYAYDATNKCYYVTGVSAQTESELYIRATYNDGTNNGEAAVTYVKWGAFMNNEVITKVILPTSVTDLHGNVFFGCSNLEYVSMKGLKSMYATNGEAREDGRWGDNNFRNCNKLKYVVIGSEGLTSNCGQFNTENVPNPTILNIYVEGTTGTVSLSSGDALWTGNVYYYSETETVGTWHYVNGIPTLW